VYEREEVVQFLAEFGVWFGVAGHIFPSASA
jgi:hypothetical protein